MYVHKCPYGVRSLWFGPHKPRKQSLALIIQHIANLLVCFIVLIGYHEGTVYSFSESHMVMCYNICVLVVLLDQYCLPCHWQPKVHRHWWREEAVSGGLTISIIIDNILLITSYLTHFQSHSLREENLPGG